MAVWAGQNRRAEELDALPEKSLCRWPGGDLGAVFMANEDDQGEDRSTLPSQGWACKVAAKPSPEQNIPMKTSDEKGNFCMALSTLCDCY